MEIKCKSKSIKMGCFKAKCSCPAIVSLIDSMIDDIRREIDERNKIARTHCTDLKTSMNAFYEIEYLYYFFYYLVDVKEQFQ